MQCNGLDRQYTQRGSGGCSVCGVPVIQQVQYGVCWCVIIIEIVYDEHREENERYHAITITCAVHTVLHCIVMLLLLSWIGRLFMLFCGV